MMTKIIKYSAPWCPACAGLTDTLNVFQNQYNFELEEIDISIDEKKGVEANIKTLPTIIIHKNNGEQERMEGQVSPYLISQTLREEKT